jgi:hypothetical protein
VVREPRRGYGAACLAGLAHLRREPRVVAFDADHSDDADLPALLAPLVERRADLVIGSRVRGERAGLAHASAGLRQRARGRAQGRLWGVTVTDLAVPVIAARRRAAGMRDRDPGWTVEMQTRAFRAGLR